MRPMLVPGRDDVAPLIASVMFVVFGAIGVANLPVGHEEVSTFPGHAARVLRLAPDGATLVAEPVCSDADAPLLVRSEGRPVLSLCAGGLSLPLLIAPYASGLPFWHALVSWPAHHGDAVGMRAWNLMAGLVVLWMLHRLVRRLADRTTADVAVLVLAPSAPFVLLHSLLLQYESMPVTLTMAALLVALGPGPSFTPRSARLRFAALLAGLAIVANVKAVFIAFGVLALAWRDGCLVRIRNELPRRHLRSYAWRFALGVAPLFVLNWLHGGGGLSRQVDQRLALLLRGATPEALGAELANFLRFATDTVSYAAPRWEPFGVVGWLSAAIVLVAFVRAVFCAARALAGATTDRVAAYAGITSVVFIGASLLLYDQRPAANYAPLFGVFAVSVATTVVAGARRIARERAAPLALGAALVVALLFGATTAGRAYSERHRAFSFDLGAERALVAYLRSQPSWGPVYTVTYNVAGVIDSLSAGSQRTTRLDRALNCHGDEDPTDDCLRARWIRLLRTPGASPARVVVPATAALTDEPFALRIEPALRAAAAEASLVVREEASFPGADGRPALRLLRLERGGPSMPPASTARGAATGRSGRPRCRGGPRLR